MSDLPVSAEFFIGECDLCGGCGLVSQHHAATSLPLEYRRCPRCSGRGEVRVLEVVAKKEALMYD